MLLKELKIVKPTQHEGAAQETNEAFHVHLRTKKAWHCACLGEAGMEEIPLLPEYMEQDNEVLAIVRMAQE